MSKYRLIANLDRYRRNFSFYCKLGILALTAGSAATLTACNPTNNNTTTPTGIEATQDPTETVKPTDSLEPTVEPTSTPTPTIEPTPTSTPTPTPEPTPTPVPTIAPSELKNKFPVSIDNIMNYEVIYNNYFGEVEDVATEMNKRMEYLKSFGILNDNEIETLVIYSNLCYLKSDNTNQEDAEKYLSKCSKKRLDTLVGIIDKVEKYNCKNKDDQCVFEYLGIGDGLNENDRMMLNYAQKNTYKLVNESTLYKTRLMPDSSISIYVNIDGQDKMLSFMLDDMTTIGKTFCLAIPFSRAEEMSKSDSDLRHTVSDMKSNLKSIKERLENPDRINLRTIGFSGFEYPESYQKKKAK